MDKDHPGTSSLYAKAYTSVEDLRKKIIETAPIDVLIAALIDAGARIEDRLSLSGDKILWIRVGSHNTWIYFDNCNTLKLYRKILIEEVNREIQEVHTVARAGIVRVYPGRT